MEEVKDFELMVSRDEQGIFFKINNLGVHYNEHLYFLTLKGHLKCYKNNVYTEEYLISSIKEYIENILKYYFDKGITTFSILRGKEHVKISIRLLNLD